ncbi:WD repeat-containing protein 43-like [Ylistrum balloti]|uniref:WD repeat-containing protein 43-like n=1 Tax=Ylistrum balloti TaxID=509963 RepID=UPI002905D20D|nr:WD repeat-containing protein 43-like [Ylistrum balloti]
MEGAVPFAISQNGNYAIHSSPDGVMKLWDTNTGTLRHEYTPSAHLSATCTCLSWCPTGNRSEKPRKKKKRKSKGDTEEIPGENSENTVAIGTTAGNVLLYNTRLGDLQTQLNGGHNGQVNGLSWQSDDGSLYSCSSDHYIVHWDISNNSVKHKWKADKGTIHSVCVCSPHHLLSAGRTIKLWNTQTHEMLKKFTGHATDVFRLIPVPFSMNLNGDSIDSLYFLSAAVNDRIVNAWHVDTKSSDKTAVASFSLPDEPVMFDISRETRPEQSLLLTVVTKAGQTLVFEHTLNGKLQQPVRPKVTIQVATPGAKEEIPRPIPVLAVHICDDKSDNILLVYGNFLKPVFEKLPYKNTDADICLIRQDKSRGSIQVEESTVSKIKTPAVSRDMTVLVPELMAPSVPSITATGKRHKRKTSTSEMTIEARLNAIGMGASKAEKAMKTPPKTDGLARLLAQGLLSKDHKIINNVLNQNDLVIENTVKRLPLRFIIPLVQHLTILMQGRAAGSHKLIKWIKNILVIHTSYLMTFPEVVEVFSSLYQLMDARTAAFSRLSKLQGKLDLILSQITTQEQHEEETSIDQPPLLMYQEDSSDDNDMVLEVNSQSDSDDNLDLFDLDEQETAGEDGLKNGGDDMETDG